VVKSGDRFHADKQGRVMNVGKETALETDLGVLQSLLLHQAPNLQRKQGSQSYFFTIIIDYFGYFDCTEQGK
jgi:hypothetical protein